MTDEEYAQTQTNLILLAQFANQMDLDGFLQRIHEAETIAPILDPTLWIRGGAKLHQVKLLARSLRPFLKEVRRQFENEATK